MAGRNLVYFVSDVHLGLDVNDPADREERFVKFLSSIPKDKTLALYMLGDIWDFWYEYRDLVPKGYVRVFSSFSVFFLSSSLASSFEESVMSASILMNLTSSILDSSWLMKGWSMLWVVGYSGTSCVRGCSVR